MGFEYDRDKSAENKRKHGIDFEVAQRLWADARLVEIPARTTDEPRSLLISTRSTGPRSSLGAATTFD
jgi:hypothetical protein